MEAYLVHARPVRQGTRVGATYSLPRSSLRDSEYDEITTVLTMRPKASFGVPPPSFPAWFEDADGTVHVPRFYGLGRFGPAEHDDRVLGEPICATFANTELNEIQRACADAVFGRELSPSGVHGAVVCLACGMGKTVWSVAAVCRLGRKACVIVHKKVIRAQWKAAFEAFCPGLRVGVIEGSTWEVDGYDVVLAMVMTVAKREYPPDVMDAFGVVVCDECHHYAAKVMHRAIRSFRARYVIGLTATKERADGLTNLLHWSMGPEGFRADRSGEHVRVSLALFAGGTPEVLTRDRKPLFSVMVNHLARNARRNAFLAERIAAMRRGGRVVIVLSDRIAQLEELGRLLRGTHGLAEEEVGLFVGKTSEQDRPRQLARPVVLCSFSQANEGVDKREADACVLATPKGRVTQAIGRIQRPCDTKQTPLVLDVVDHDVGVFDALRWKRLRAYRREKYDVQVVEVGKEGEEEWFA